MTNPYDKPALRFSAKGGFFLFPFFFFSVGFLFFRPQVRTAAKGGGSLFYSILFFSRPQIFFFPFAGFLFFRPQIRTA